MSEPAVQTIRPAAPLKAGHAMIFGRISEYERTENGTCYTIIQTPAPDEYSHPGNHKVTSQRPLGKVGEDCRVLVRLAGFRRSYQNKHGEKVVTVDNALYAVDE